MRKRPVRPTWLSSEHRTISTIPPVLTPAEQEAVRKREAEQDAPVTVPSSVEREAAHSEATQGDARVTDAIDRAAQEGASPYAEDPTTEIRQAPPADRADGDGPA